MSNGKTKAVLAFDGRELTGQQAAAVTGLKYIDNDWEHADDLQITTGEEGLLSGVSEISLLLQTDNWHGTKTMRTADCGTFSVDDRESICRSNLYITKASAVAAVSGIRQTPRFKAWERFNLKELAAEIAGRNQTALVYAAEYNPVFARKEQINTSDIKFLSGLCRLSGLRLKFTRNSLVIYNPYAYSQGSPVRTFTRGETDILKDELKHRKDDTDYAQCRVSYKDPVTKELISYTYKLRETGRRLDVQQKVTSTEEATMLARHKIMEKNCREYTGCITCEGDISLATGSRIALSGYGEYDRDYIIAKAVHQIQVGVYTTQVFFEMAMEGDV